MSELVDKDPFEEIEASIRQTFNALGPEIEADVRQLIDVPVEYRGGGRRRIRSQPGQPPRREFGTYQSSQFYSVYEDASGLTLFVGPAMQQRGSWLEFGTHRIAPRPHFAPLREKWTAIACQRIAAGISGS